MSAATSQGMLLARFRLEHQFGFRIGGLLGDGFIGNGRLRIDFAAMRVSVEDEDGNDCKGLALEEPTAQGSGAKSCTYGLSERRTMWI